MEEERELPEKEGIKSARKKYYAQRKKQLSRKLYIKKHKFNTHSVRVQRAFDEEKGKAIHKLIIEEEPGTKTNPFKNKRKQISNAGRNFVNQKVSEAEAETDNNMGSEATRRGLLEADDIKEMSQRMYDYHDRNKILRLEKKQEKYAGKESYEDLKANLRESYPKPSMQKQAQKKQQKKQMQKRRMKNNYKKRKAASTAKNSTKLTKDLLSSILKLLKSKTGIILCSVFLIVALLLSVIPSFFMLFMCSSGILDCWLSDPSEIEKTELEYTRMEAELEQRIENIEKEYSGYDSYTYSISEIKHNPIALINYLSAEHVEFTYDEIKDELVQIFHRQYVFTTDVTATETETTDEKGKKVTTTERTLNIKLAVTQIEEMAMIDFSWDEDTNDLYKTYCDNNGGLQTFETPLELSWYQYVGSYYGYEYSGSVTKDCGLELMCPNQSEVKAMSNGIVTKSEKAGKYGNYVQMQFGTYTINYAHLNEISVAVGKQIKTGDVIGKTTSNLYVEIIEDGEYINPIFYIENGKGTYPGYNLGNNAPDISVVAGDNQAKVWTYLKGIGFSDAGAAAVMGNIDAESSFDPTSNNSNIYFGICQWGRGRWMGNPICLYEFSNGNWTDLQVQLDFFNLECRKCYGSVYTQMKKANDVAYATDYFCVYYEGCVGKEGNWAISQINGKPYQSLDDRINFAKQYYSIYANKG